jgi:AsmA protein
LQGKLQYRAGAVPYLLVDMTGDSVDVDHLKTVLASQTSTQVPIETTQPDKQSASNENKGGSSSGGDEPWPLADLVAMPGDYRLGVKQLRANGLQWQNLQLSVQVKGEQLVLQTLRADGYQGVVQASGVLKAPKQARPHLTIDVSASNLQLTNFLRDLQQQASKVSAGVFNMRATLQSEPVNQQAFLGTLGGNAEFDIAGLVIDEINIEQRVCEAAAKLEGKSLPARTWSNQTELRETRGKATIRQGVVQLDPVVARLDTLDLRGTGPVSLVDDTLDLPLDLKLVNDAAAANFCEVMNPRLADINWPLRCRGNYVNQSGKDLCGVDRERLDDLIRQVAQKKVEQKIDEKLKEKFGGEADKFKEGLRKLFK